APKAEVIVSTSKRNEQKKPNVRSRRSNLNVYEITILVRVLDRDAVMKHGRSAYAKAPALIDDGQLIPAEEFVSCLDDALLELYRLPGSDSKGVEQLEFAIKRNP